MLLQRSAKDQGRNSRVIVENKVACSLLAHGLADTRYARMSGHQKTVQASDS